MADQGLVSPSGLAPAPAADDPGTMQSAPVLVSRDGQLAVRMCDAGGFPEGNKRYVERVTARVPTNALVNDFQVLNKPGRYQQSIGFVVGVGDPGTYVYIQLHNKVAALQLGDVPQLEWPVLLDNGTFTMGFEDDFSVGLRIAVSTTQGTFTSAGAIMWAAVKALTGGG